MCKNGSKHEKSDYKSAQLNFIPEREHSFWLVITSVPSKGCNLVMQICSHFFHA